MSEWSSTLSPRKSAPFFPAFRNKKIKQQKAPENTFLNKDTVLKWYQQ